MTQMTNGDTHVCIPMVEGDATEYLCPCGEVTRMHTLKTGEVYWCRDHTRDSVEQVIKILAQPGVSQISEGSI